jgi:hypothetical protein
MTFGCVNGEFIGPLGNSVFHVLSLYLKNGAVNNPVEYGTMSYGLGAAGPVVGTKNGFDAGLK